MQLRVAVTLLALSACATATPTGGKPSLDELGHAVAAAVGARDLDALVMLSASLDSQAAVCKGPGEHVVVMSRVSDGDLNASLSACTADWSRATNVSVTPARSVPIRGCAAEAYERVVVRAEIEGRAEELALEGLRLAENYYLFDSFTCGAPHPLLPLVEALQVDVCACADPTCARERLTTYVADHAALSPRRPPSDDELVFAADALERTTECLGRLGLGSTNIH